MTFSRHADLDWTGTLTEGSGSVKAGTGTFTVPVSWPSRIGEPAGKTSPEELMAAAHAACFAMVVAGALGRKPATADRLSVTATITADKGDAGLKIQASALKVVAHGLKGMDAAEFATMAKEAEGRCPVSNVYRAMMTITVDASAA